MPSRPLTAEQRQDARRLKAIYDQWKINNPHAGPQEEIAATAGTSQSAFSQRLNGTLALNAEAAVAFAKLLSCDVADFSPTLAHRISLLTSPSVSPETRTIDAVDSTSAARDLMDVRAVRRAKIQTLVAAAGGPTDFAETYGNGKWKQPQVSQWISPKAKNIGHNLAREIEKALGLPSGWMDQPGHADGDFLVESKSPENEAYGDRLRAAATSRELPPNRLETEIVRLLKAAQKSRPELVRAATMMLTAASGISAEDSDA